MLFHIFYNRYTTEIKAGMVQFETGDFEWHEIGVLNYVIKRARKEMLYSEKTTNRDIFNSIHNHYLHEKRTEG